MSGFRSSNCACAGNIPVILAQLHPGDDVDVFRALKNSCWPSHQLGRPGSYSIMGVHLQLSMKSYAIRWAYAEMDMAFAVIKDTNSEVFH